MLEISFCKLDKFSNEIFHWDNILLEIIKRYIFVVSVSGGAKARGVAGVF